MTTQDQFIKTLQNGEILNEKFIFKFVEEFINLNNLDDSLENITFIDENDTLIKETINAVAAYGNKWMIIDYKGMVKDIISFLKINIKKLSSEDLTNINLSIIRVIYHELIHAKHHNMINNKDEDINDLLVNSINMSKNEQLYRNNHDIFLDEYNANIMSAFLTDFYYDEIIETVLKEHNPYLYEFVYLYLYCGYKNNSPLEKYNAVTNQKLEPINNIELFDKICYGMPINEEEKFKIKKLAKAKMDNYNIIDYLNNKL